METGKPPKGPKGPRSKARAIEDSRRREAISAAMKELRSAMGMACRPCGRLSTIRKATIMIRQLTGGEKEAPEPEKPKRKTDNGGGADSNSKDMEKLVEEEMTADGAFAALGAEELENLKQIEKIIEADQRASVSVISVIKVNTGFNFNFNHPE
jgi:hypothetical protein